MADFKDIIKKHLEQMAGQDPAFAERYNREDKSLDNCIKYITAQARKTVKSGGTWLEDAVVLGWAVHYYQEDNKEVEKDVKSAPKSVKMGHVGESKPSDVVRTKVDADKNKGVVKVKKGKAKKETKCIEFDLFEGMF